MVFSFLIFFSGSITDFFRLIFQDFLLFLSVSTAIFHLRETLLCAIIIIIGNLNFLNG